MDWRNPDLCKFTQSNLPAKLFDVHGKPALIVSATGAFGKVVCATLGNTGAQLAIAAGNASGNGVYSGWDEERMAE
jgi:hypothetical protein